MFVLNSKIIIALSSPPLMQVEEYVPFQNFMHCIQQTMIYLILDLMILYSYHKCYTG